VLQGFAILLACQFCGELLVRVTGWPVPGNVLGMLLLLLALMLELVSVEWVSQAAELLLSHMAVFFIPVGVAVMLHFELLTREWLPILAATVISTFLVIAVTGLVAGHLAGERRTGEGDDG
jgi:holin-like protein